LVGLLKPKSGTINIFERKVTRNRKELWEIRKQIGFLFQNPDDQLFAPTLEEDIAFGARNLKLEEKIINKRVNWALEAVDLSDSRTKSPFQLSWGQKKRAALAGLLVMKPKLLILDEPFANLDLTSIKKHITIFENLMKNSDLTILFTSHNMFFVENWAEKMLVINDGRSIYEGSPIQGLVEPKIRNLIGSYEDILNILKGKK
jgi:cobalt/nickel transport system ATP-binding protein